MSGEPNRTKDGLIRYGLLAAAWVSILLFTGCSGPGPSNGFEGNPLYPDQTRVEPPHSSYTSHSQSSLDRRVSSTDDREPPSLPDQPLTLDQAISIGLSRNPEVHSALEKIKIARAKLGQAASGYYPHLSSGISYTRTNQAAQSFFMKVSQQNLSPTANVNDPQETGNYRSELRLSYPLFSGGQVVHRTAAAEKRIELRTYRKKGVQNQLIHDITRAFYQIQKAREQKRIAEGSLNAVQSQLDRVNKQVREGAALESDKRSLEVRVAETRQRKIRAQNAIEQGRTALKTLLGLDGDPSIRVQTKEDETVEESIPDSNDALRKAYRHRPELAGAKSMVEARKRKLLEAQGDYYPELQAFGAYGHDHYQLDYTDDKYSWTLGIELSYDLFSGFRAQEKAREARHNVREGMTRQRKTRLMIQKEVRNARVALRNDLSQLEVTRTSVESAQEALRMVRSQYREGAVPVTRFLEAEADLSEARSRHQSAVYDVYISRNNLKRATGELLKEDIKQ